MDQRICNWVENTSGLSIQTFPKEGVRVCISPARTDQPKNRLLVQQITGKNGALVTVIPRILKTIKPCLEKMTAGELFSPLGLSEIKHVLSPEDSKSFDEYYGLDYFLTERKNFRPVEPRHKVIELKKKDIPPGDVAMRLGERRSTEKGDFTWAFACYH